MSAMCSPQWCSLIIRIGLLVAVTANAPAAPPSASQEQPASLPHGVAVVTAPASQPSTSFVVVQTSYLEQLATAQKQTIEAVAATSQEAIKAAKDKEEWLVRITQTVGIVFAAIALVLGYFGVTKYGEVRDQLNKINKAAETAEQASTSVAATASRLSDEFTERISQIEKLFVGIQTQKMIMSELNKSTDKKKDAFAAAAETISLYELAVTHKNPRIQSYIAATLTIIYKHTENWDEAARYGQVSVDCNPKRWPDRIFNLACIYARRFAANKDQGDRERVTRLLTEYFEREGQSKVAIAEINDAMKDEDLKLNSIILADIERIKKDYSKPQDKQNNSNA